MNKMNYGSLEPIYKESSKILLKEIKHVLNKWGDIPKSWIRKIMKIKSFPS